MIFIKIKENNEVDCVHFKPFDDLYGLGKTEAELLEDGFLVEIMPAEEQIENKRAVLTYNPADNTLFYNYVDIPKTEAQIQSEKIITLQSELTNTKLAMAELVEQQQADKLNNQLALAEVIESITGGGTVA